MTALIKPCTDILCPHCAGIIPKNDPRRTGKILQFKKYKPVSISPLPNSIGGGLPVTPGSANYTSAGSYTFSVPPYNVMYITVNGAGGSGGGGGTYYQAGYCNGGSGGGGGGC